MNRNDAERFAARWAAAVASPEPADLASLLAPDVRDTSSGETVIGPASFTARAAAVHARLEAIAVAVDAIVCEDDRVAWRWTLRGVAKESGAAVLIHGVNFQRLANGRVVEHDTLTGTR